MQSSTYQTLERLNQGRNQKLFIQGNNKSKYRETDQKSDKYHEKFRENMSFAHKQTKETKLLFCCFKLFDQRPKSTLPIIL